MRKLLVIVSALAFLLYPTLSLAAEFRPGGPTATVGANETVNDDLYISAGDVTIDGTVNGDLFAAGGQVRVNGTINGDLFIAGGNLTVSGTVTDDLRAAGGNVTVSGKVGDDVLAAGGNVDIARGAEIAGELRAGAGNVTVAGTTGRVEAGVGTLTVTSTARINGDLRYTSTSEATIQDGATITGQTVRQAPKPQPVQQVVKVGGFFPLIGLVMALLFLYLLPNKSAAVAREWRARFGWGLLWGFLFLIGLPFAALILLVSIVGSPVAVGLGLLYPIFLYLGSLVAAIAFGTWLMNLWMKEKEPRPTWISVLLGVIAVTILGLIPFVGWLLVFLIWLAGLGVLVKYDWDVLARLRREKTF